MKFYQKALHQQEIRHPWDPRYHFYDWLHIPLAYLKKGVIDTFKPYKTRHQAWKDIFQPFQGIYSLFYGYTAWLLTPIPLVILPFLMLTKWYKSNEQPSIWKDISYSGMAKTALTWSLLAILTSLIHIVKGTLELFLTPLTWLIRIPLRAIITHFSTPKLVEKNNGMVKLADAGDVLLKLLKSENGVDEKNKRAIQITAIALLEKCKKATLDRNQKTTIEVGKTESNMNPPLELMKITSKHGITTFFVSNGSTDQTDDFRRDTNTIRFFHYHVHKAPANPVATTPSTGPT